jgi:hypothetical protein
MTFLLPGAPYIGSLLSVYDVLGKPGLHLRNVPENIWASSVLSEA